jgi:hypothetical protein
MEPHGAALLVYFAGDTAAVLIGHREDGQTAQIPVSHFFRPPSACTSIEEAALAGCR